MAVGTRAVNNRTGYLCRLTDTGTTLHGAQQPAVDALLQYTFQVNANFIRIYHIIAIAAYYISLRIPTGIDMCAYCRRGRSNRRASIE